MSGNVKMEFDNMVMESYFVTHTMPKGMKRGKRRYMNENDPKNDGKTKFQNDYGIDHINND